MATPQDIADELHLTPDVVGERLAAIGLTAEARQRLRAAAPASTAHRAWFIDQLYDRFAANPETAALLTNPAQVARLKQQQHRYLQELIEADLDWSYALRRLAIGVVHHSVALPPQWYLTTYALVLCDHVDLFFRTAPDAATALAWTRTITRTVFFDASLVLDAYGRSRDAALWQQARQANAPADGDLPTTPASTGDGSPRWPSARINLTREGTDLRRDFIGLSDDDILHLRALAPAIEAHSAAVLDDFYRYIAETPALAPLVPPQVAVSLRRQVASYWLELAGAAFDRPYAASRMRIGVMHEQIGLDTDWYLTGLARQLTGFYDAIDFTQAGAVDQLRALIRAVFFDLSFVIDAYMQARADTLLRTEGYASQLVAGLAAGVAVIDTADRLVSANRTLVAMVGGEASVLYLMPIERALPIPEAAALVRGIRQARDGEEHARLAGIGRLGARSLRLTAMRLNGAAGNLDGAIALVVDDVTDLFRVSDDLDQRRDQIERLPDAIGVIQWELDLLSWTITSIGGAIDELTGYRDVFFLGRASAWIDRIVEADRALFVSRASTLKPGERGEVEYRIRRSDGSEVWVRTWMGLARRGTVLVLAAATVDITARKRSDALRLEAISTIAAGVAHVVNNALTGVIGGIEMHARERGGLDEAPMLRLALESARTAGTTTEQLLAFSGQQALDGVELSLSQVTQSALPMLRALLGDAVTVKLDLDDQLWLCHADERMLVRTLECLADNSRQAMHGTGTFTVTTRNRAGRELAATGVDATHDWVEWRIADTGDGMSEEVRRQAIHPFFTTRSLAESSGLGLSMVYGLTTQLGGDMTIDSQPGQGTTVTLRLPRSSVAVVVAPEPQAPLVLVVEDQEDVRVVTTVMLKALGYRVIDTGDVNEARRLAEILKPQILLTDVILGQGLDGIALATQMAAEHPDLSIVVMSGYSKLNLDADRFPAAFQFLPKPFTLDDLDARLRQTRYPPPPA